MEKITASDPQANSLDIVRENIEQLHQLFPEAFTEGKVDFEVLKQLLGASVEEREEKFGLNWHGKRRARELALTPSLGTLRPCPEDSVDWDTTQNVMIEGDNLEVLKLLQKSYAGKVKVIYIDPPYNTGKDFVYPDNFTNGIANYLALTGQAGEGGGKLTSNSETSGRFHTDWLNMMYARLRVARSLLKSDGVIFISIDENEIQRLRILCDELFGEECFVACLTVLCNPKGRSQDKYFATNHEYLLAYSKTVLPAGSFAIAKEEAQVLAEYSEEDDAGRYRLLELRNTHRDFGRHNRRNLHYPLYCDDLGVVFVEDGEARHTVLPNWDDGFEGCWTWGADKSRKDVHLLTARRISGRWKIYRKSYASGADRMLKTILNDPHFFTERGQKELGALFGTKAKLFQSPKSPFLIAQIVQCCTEEGDIVCDFFAGSGTTGHSVMLQASNDGMSRRFLLTQMPEPLGSESKEQADARAFCLESGLAPNLIELTKERLRRAGRQVREGNPLFAGDLGFRVFKLDSTNIREWDASPGNIQQELQDSIEHIKQGRSEQDVLYELLIKLGLDLCVPIEKRDIAGKTVHSIGAGVLLACLSESITPEDVEPLAQGIVDWHKTLETAGDVVCVFRDSAFADDVAKTNLAAILNQSGLTTVRSL